jgi:inositol-phosphate phosphatase / L-galactose 1-phosphate phosphatase / histidinol-phosphatase
VRDTDIALAQRLADAAGAVIRPHFRTAFAVEDKGDASPVTVADREAEAAMRRIVEAECPRDGIIGEEYGVKDGPSGRSWVLDPIDGTTSFVAGRPIFGTLIALVEDGWPVLGVIDQPVARERWVGAVGRATEFNRRAVTARRCPDLAQAVLATTSPNLFDDDEAVRFLAVASKVARRRIVYGGDCYNYGLIASGHVDLVVEAGLKLHDFAALVPIVEGAGGTMCDWSGEPLSAESAGDPGSGSGARVIALGDPARLEDVVAALALA